MNRAIPHTTAAIPSRQNKSRYRIQHCETVLQRHAYFKLLRLLWKLKTHLLHIIISIALIQNRIPM